MFYRESWEDDLSYISLPRGQRSSEEREVLQAITKKLEEHLPLLYPPEDVLPYHGVHHVQQVRSDAAVYVNRCRQQGIAVDTFALDHALLCHDLLYGVDPALFGFESREDLAAFYAEQFLLKNRASSEHASYVAHIISSTKANTLPKEVEEIIMRAADLANLAGDFETFAGQTACLYREHRLLTQSPKSFADFVTDSIVHLSGYTRRN